MGHMENVVTEEADKRKEERRIRNALADCGYPKWALNRVKQQMRDKHDKPQQPKTSKKNNETPSRGMVVIPYVEGVAGQMKRAFQKHSASDENLEKNPCPPQIQKGHYRDH